MKIYGTAKGGALSTKDFGVAFGGAAAAAGCSAYADSITTTAAGTVSGAVIDTDSQHFGDGCLSFDGSNDLVACNGLLPTMRGSVGSFTFWFNCADTTLDTVLGFGDTNANSMIILYVENNKISITGRSAAQENFQGNISSAINTWHHIAVVQDGVAVKVYHDGTEFTMTNTTDLTYWIDTSIDNFRLGCSNRNNFGDVDFFAGFIQGVCFWDVAISDDVRAYIYNSGAGRPISALCPTYNSDDIIAWYNCQSLTNSTLVNNATPVS